MVSILTASTRLQVMPSVLTASPTILLPAYPDSPPRPLALQTATRALFAVTVTTCIFTCRSLHASWLTWVSPHSTVSWPHTQHTQHAHIIHSLHRSPDAKIHAHHGHDFAKNLGLFHVPLRVSPASLSRSAARPCGGARSGGVRRCRR